MIGSPPTMTSVNVTLKSVVSYQENGSSHVPLYCAGMLSGLIPFKFEFEGCPFEDVPDDPEFFESFLLTTTPTAIATARMIARIRRKKTVRRCQSCWISRACR